MQGYFSQHTASAQEAARFTGTRAFDSLEALLPVCDVLFLTVPDGRIPQVFERLRRLTIENKYICHCSGALSAHDAFPGIGETGAFGYSVHPLFAVSDRYHAYEELPDLFFALEGHPARLEAMRDLLTGAGLTVRVLDADCKVKYHAAAVLASNLMLALAWQSLQLLEECGFSPGDAQKALGPLMLGNLRHIVQDGPVASLTGPVERDDRETVAKHLAALPEGPTREVYRLLSQSLVQLARQKHPQRGYEAMEQLLKGDYIHAEEEHCRHSAGDEAAGREGQPADLL